MTEEQHMSIDQDLLNLFSGMIDDKTERLILQLLFTNNDIEKMLDELVKTLEQGQDD